MSHDHRPKASVQRRRLAECRIIRVLQLVNRLLGPALRVQLAKTSQNWPQLLLLLLLLLQLQYQNIASRHVITHTTLFPTCLLR